MVDLIFGRGRGGGRNQTIVGRQWERVCACGFCKHQV